MTLADLLAGLAVALTVTGFAWWVVPRLATSVDECWHLVVVRRVRQGRRLYRGVFYGAGPWSVWVSRLLVRWFGERLVMMRRTMVVLSVAVGAAAWAWTSVLDVPAPLGLAVAAGTALCTTPWTPDNHYGVWSRIGVFVALAGAAGIDEPATAVAVTSAGLALAMLNKYTLGVAAVPAVILSGEPGPVLLALLVAAVLTAGGYAVEARGGVGPSIVQRLFRNKRTFVATAASGFLARWRAGPGGLEWRASWPAYALTALAVGAVAAHAVASALRREEPSWATLGLILVAFAALWPRADEVHVRGSLALSTAPGLVAADRLAPALGVAWGVLVVTAGLASAAFAVVEARRVRLPEAVGTPFDGVHPWPWDLDEVRAGGEELRELTGGEVVLIRPDAAVWYLATGLCNPTPYDYPLASTFGPDGQDVLVANLASGRVRYCCWHPASLGLLTPTVVETYVAGLPVLAITRAGRLVTGR